MSPSTIRAMAGPGVGLALGMALLVPGGVQGQWTAPRPGDPVEVEVTRHPDGPRITLRIAPGWYVYATRSTGPEGGEGLGPDPAVGLPLRVVQVGDDRDAVGRIGSPPGPAPALVPLTSPDTVAIGPSAVPVHRGTVAFRIVTEPDARGSVVGEKRARILWAACRGDLCIARASPVVLPPG